MARALQTSDAISQHRRTDSRLCAALQIGSAVIVLTITVLALIGWAVGSETLTSVWRGAIPMNPITAVDFLLGAVALLALRGRGRWRTASQVAAALVVAIGGLRLVAILTGLDLHVDQLLFRSELARQTIPNRMAPNTAVAFLLTGLGLLLSGSDRVQWRRVAQFAIVPSLALSMSAVLGYAYRDEQFARIGSFIPMAVNTAACFMLLGVGMLSTHTRSGLMRLLSSQTIGSRMARRLMLSIVVVLPMLGWLTIIGGRNGWYGMAYGSALLVMASIAVLVVLILIGTSAYHRLEESGQLVQEKLARIEERLETAVRGSNDGLWDWSRATGELHVSPRFHELLGYTAPSTTMDFTPFDLRPGLIHEEDGQRIDHVFLKHLTDRSLLDIDLRLQMRDGQYRWFRVRGQAAREGRRRTCRIAGSITDISDVKLAESAALAAHSEAEEASRAKSDFMSRMSHELRTPLNAVLGFAQLIEFDAKTADEKTNVEQILKAGNHLLALIDEILDISRIEAGKLFVSVEPVPVGEILDEVIQLMAPIAAQRGIALLSVRDSVWEECALVDRQRLKQVLLNLTSNAIKYNSDGGAVRLSCIRYEPDEIRVLVSDDGNGIGESVIARLFTPFDRLGAEGGPVEGTGLGLALSKRLVELMGGRIGLESTVGVGSTFYVNFARVEAPAAAAGTELFASDTTSLDIQTCSRTVLYVEDNKPNLDLIESIFKRRPNINLISTMQGRMGIELAREHHPDLILLDMNLPDIHGRQVLAALKADERTKRIPVVVISADAVSSRIHDLLEGGALAYLTKPIAVPQFLEVVDDALRAA